MRRKDLFIETSLDILRITSIPPITNSMSFNRIFLITQMSILFSHHLDIQLIQKLTYIGFYLKQAKKLMLNTSSDTT